MTRGKGTLVMLSGGVDSTYTLARLLRETCEPVHAHHIHLINPEGRDQVEARACDRIVDYCRRNYRRFGYSESVIIRSGEAFGLDIMSVALEAGIASMNMDPLPKWWMVGDCEEDHDNPLRTPRRDEGIRGVIQAACYPEEAPILKEFTPKPKNRLMAYMGPELSAMCWACRTPVKKGENYLECGDCKSCRHMRKAREDMNPTFSQVVY